MLENENKTKELFFLLFLPLSDTFFCLKAQQSNVMYKANFQVKFIQYLVVSFKTQYTDLMQVY